MRCGLEGSTRIAWLGVPRMRCHVPPASSARQSPPMAPMRTEPGRSPTTAMENTPGAGAAGSDGNGAPPGDATRSMNLPAATEIVPSGPGAITVPVTPVARVPKVRRSLVDLRVPPARTKDVVPSDATKTGSLGMLVAASQVFPSGLSRTPPAVPTRKPRWMAARDRIESLPGMEPWTRPFDRITSTRAPRNSTLTPTPTYWMPRCRRRGGALRGGSGVAIRTPPRGWPSERRLEGGDLDPARADHHPHDIETALPQERSPEGEAGLGHPAKPALLVPVHHPRRIDVRGAPA